MSKRDIIAVILLIGGTLGMVWLGLRLLLLFQTGGG